MTPTGVIHERALAGRGRPLSCAGGRQAREFCAKVNSLSARLAPQTNSASQSGDSIPEQIRQLAELRDEGVLTSDEFEAKKVELLSRL